MKFTALTISLLFVFFSALFSQNVSEGYKFTMQKQLPATPVKDQNRTNTCWSFSAVSMLESELLKKGKGEYDLSEMFIVYHSYLRKADKYARMHGKIEFAGGGENNDVTDVFKTWGIVPESSFSGLKIGETGHNHVEMDKVLKAYMDELVKTSNQTLSPVWLDGFDGILKSYLGTLSQQFNFKEKAYTPATFASSLEINPDDYIMVSSFTHHPFYASFIPELPDNWSWGKAYNVPLDEMQSIVEYAINTGYTVSWASDISDKGFNFRQGVAIVPDFDSKSVAQTDWDKAFAAPGNQKKITQELRQVDFDNYATTDDHGMHITGLSTDQAGNKFFYVKNSWGTENPYKGYIYVSDAFFRLRTTVIFLNKNAIPETIRKKLRV